jgi:hypothetical protein
VLPKAVSDWLIVCTDAEMVMVFPALPTPMPAPAEIDIAPEEPFSDWT